MAGPNPLSGTTPANNADWRKWARFIAPLIPVNFTWRSLFDVNTLYRVHDVVFYSGSLWIANSGPLTGAVPGVDTRWELMIAAGGGPPPAHATSHENGGTDEINVGGLAGLLADPQTPLAHAGSHEDGGTDEMDVTGLSGQLADPQTPLAHHTAHEAGGGDAIKLDDLAAPDDNTDLNASVAAHGLLPKLSGDGAEYLGGDGNWNTFVPPPAGLDDPGANGLVVRIAPTTTIARTIVGGGRVTIVDGDGVADNPGIAIDFAGGNALSLTTEVTGTLPIANGGTGQVTAPLALRALGGWPAALGHIGW